MARAIGIDDMFGHVPQKGELSLPATPARSSAEDGDGRINGIVRAPPGGHTPDTIRVQMMLVLDEARAAATLPWGPRKVRSFTAMFPYWAEWLKGGEGDRLLLEFKHEMDRLGAPLDQVAPNWRRIWGLPA